MTAPDGLAAFTLLADMSDINDWKQVPVLWRYPDWSPTLIDLPGRFSTLNASAVSTRGSAFAVDGYTGIAGSTPPTAATAIWWDGAGAAAEVFSFESGNAPQTIAVSPASSRAYAWVPPLGTTDDNQERLLMLERGGRVTELAKFDAVNISRESAVSDDGRSAVAFVGTIGPGIGMKWELLLVRDGVVDRVQSPSQAGYVVSATVARNGNTATFTMRDASESSFIECKFVQDGGAWIQQPVRHVDLVGVTSLDASHKRWMGYSSDVEDVVVCDVYHGARLIRDVERAWFPDMMLDALKPSFSLFENSRNVIGINTIDRPVWIAQIPALADLNEDGVRDDADLSLFVDALMSGRAAADWNLDGFLDFQDFDEFIADFESGQ